MSEDLYYIISTKQSACLNDLFSTGTFRHIRRNQPDSGPFLDAVLPSHRPVVHLALFDRVDGSENSWKMSHIYELKSIQRDSNKDSAKEPHYELLLTPTDNITPIDFYQDSELWKNISVTQNKKTTNFFNSRRVLLRIEKEDFETILRFGKQSQGEVFQQEVTSDSKGVPFKLESELRDYLSDNLDRIESGLRPWDDAFIEKDTGTLGRIDILARDVNGCPVVIELKKGLGDDAVVGQICRYITWAKENLAYSGQVRGIIIANVISNNLKASARAVSNVSIMSYEIQFNIRSAT